MFQRRKALNSSTLRRRHNKKYYKTQGIRSQVSPFCTSRCENELIEHSASVASSLGSFVKSPSVDQESWELQSIESPILASIRQNICESADSEDQIEPRHDFIIQKRQRKGLLQKNLSPVNQNTLNSLTPYMFDTLEPDNQIVCGVDIKEQLNKQKQVLIRKYRKALEEQRNKLLEKFQDELETLKEQLIKKLKQKQQKVLAAKEKEFEKNYRNEIERMQKRHELQLNGKIEEISGEYERTAARLQEELVWVRKQNENLKRQLEDARAKSQLVKSTNRMDSMVTNTTIDQSKQLSEIYKNYNQLQHDYVELKKKQSSNLCCKCKAFTQTNSELEGKISRIRAYIGKSPASN